MTGLGQLGPAAYENLTVEELKEQLVILDDKMYKALLSVDSYLTMHAQCMHILIKKLSGGVEGLGIDQNL